MKVDAQLPTIDDPAHTRLSDALVSAVNRGQFVPCSPPWDGDSPWLSDDPDERRWAARLCADCPAITECREAGQAEGFGIWGGIDRTPTKTSAQPARINRRKHS